MIFERVVCGVDGTPEGMTAAWQGARLSNAIADFFERVGYAPS